MDLKKKFFLNINNKWNIIQEQPAISHTNIRVLYAIIATKTRDFIQIKFH